MTVHVYQSTDPGAPVHPSSTRGSMAALLRACLVTGYGAGDSWFDPAGWEEPFVEANNCACFRATSGARQFFQIDDTQTSANVTLMRAYESMSDAETGEGNWASRYFGKFYSSDTATSWMVISDERTCYVFLRGKYGNVVPHGFGEFASCADDDPYNSFVVGHGGSSVMEYASTSPLIFCDSITSTASRTGTVHKSHSGDSSVFQTLSVGAGVIGYRNGSSGFADTATDDGVGWYALPLLIKAVADVNGTVGGGLLRGMLRGVHQPLVDLGTNFATVTIGGNPFWAFETDGNNYNFGQLLIAAGDWA